MPPLPKDGQYFNPLYLLYLMNNYLVCTGIFEVEEWMIIRKHVSTSVSRSSLGLIMCQLLSLLLQIQWEWQESSTTWRPYGRIENRIIEVCS